MVSHWVLVPAPLPLSAGELDAEILARSAAWNARYVELGSFAEAQPSHCVSVRYEDLDAPETYLRLADFLETSPFDFRPYLQRIHGVSRKSGAAVALLRERMAGLRPRIAELTSPACRQYGYAKHTV